MPTHSIFCILPSLVTVVTALQTASRYPEANGVIQPLRGPYGSKRFFRWMGMRRETTFNFWEFRNGQQRLDAAKLKDHRGRTWRTSTVEGVAEDIHKHFGEVNPFDHFLEEIKEKYQSPMTALKCASLFTFIENHPPEGYDVGSEWIGKFVESNIDEFTKRAQAWKRDHPPPRLEDLKDVIV